MKMAINFTNLLAKSIEKIYKRKYLLGLAWLDFYFP